MGRLLVRAGIWTVAACLVIAAATWSARQVLDSPWLAVSHIVVQGNVRLSAGDVEALVGGARGQNILRLDLERYRRRVMDSPWVASVTLWRHLPSTLEVRIVERVPLATARLGQQLYLVDSAGMIIDEYGAAYRQFDLPVVDGLMSSSETTGSLADPARVRLTGALFGALESNPSLERRVSQVDVSNPHDAVVLVGDDPAWLHLGDTRFVERLTTYFELGPALKERFHDVDYVDLRFDDHVYVHARGAPKGG
jgi:cell division protein FtsQ